MCTGTSASATSRASSIVSSSVEATGFSQKVGMPVRDPRAQQWRVAGGGGGDHQGVDARVEQRVGRGRPLQPLLGRHLLGARRVDVGHHELVDGIEAVEGLGVEGADPADAGESDAHVAVPFTVGAVSDGGRGTRGGRASCPTPSLPSWREPCQPFVRTF